MDGFCGYTPAEELALGDVAKMVSRGGLQSMFLVNCWLFWHCLWVGFCEGLGILPALLDGMRHLLTHASRGVAIRSIYLTLALMFWWVNNI